MKLAELAGNGYEIYKEYMPHSTAKPVASVGEITTRRKWGKITLDFAKCAVGEIVLNGEGVLIGRNDVFGYVVRAVAKKYPN